MPNVGKIVLEVSRRHPTSEAGTQLNPKFMPDLGPESWQTTEKSESYATEQGIPWMESRVGGRQKNQLIQRRARSAAALQPSFLVCGEVV